jgi:WD40 repeat protein
MASCSTICAVTKNFVGCVTFSADGRYILSGGYDQTIHIWRAADGALVQVWRGPTSYTDPIVPLPDGRWVASCGWKEEHVWLWRWLPHPDAVTPLEHLGDAYWEWVR